MAPKTKTKSSSSKAMADGSGSSAQTAAAPPADVRAQAQIQTILQAKAQELSGDLTEILQRLSTSDAVDGASVKWDPSQPSREPRACCFDTASAPLPSAWTVHALCRRCQELQVLLQCE